MSESRHKNLLLSPPISTYYLYADILPPRTETNTPMGMAKPLVLITGINGYIAAHTARAFLQAGYAVRGTVRDAESKNAKALVRALSQYHQDNDRGLLEIVEVPDISAVRAFDGAVKGVSAIAHLASPVSMTTTDPGPMMRAAVEGTASLLSSVQLASRHAPGILKSIVFMSSISAVYSPEVDTSQHTFTGKDWNLSAERDLAALIAQQRTPPGYLIYQASKVAAERAFWDSQREGASVGVVMASICPAPTIGPPLFLPTPIETLSMRAKDIHSLLQGGPIPELSGAIRATFVDVRDVADIIVAVVTRHLHDSQNKTPSLSPSSQEQQTASSPSERGSEQREQERLICVAADNVSPAQMAALLRETFSERQNIIREPDLKEDRAILDRLASASPTAGEKFNADPARRYLPDQKWIDFKTSVLDNARVFIDDAENDSSSS